MPSDIRALGRLGDAMSSPQGGRRRRRPRLVLGRDRGMHVARRRGRVPTPFLWALAVLAVVLLWVGFAANRQADDVPVSAAQAHDTLEAVPADVPARPADADRASRNRATAATERFAAVDGLELVLPHPEPTTVAFHEASRPEALALEPLGRLEGNDNPTKFDPPAEILTGPSYRVLASRGRARPATSAADVVVPEGSTVLAPVTGRVVEVQEYALYGKTRDWRVVLEPDERPDLHVVLVHLHQPAVSVGDEVQAGVTGLARVRKLPFPSHVDYVTDHPEPHTHIEVKAGTPAEPLDPNAPALPPEPAD